jgi:hypothetical protein
MLAGGGDRARQYNDATPRVAREAGARGALIGASSKILSHSVQRLCVYRQGIPEQNKVMRQKLPLV